MLKGTTTDEEAKRVFARGTEIRGLPLIIDEKPSRTISSIRSRARRVKRRQGVGVIFIDYLQLIPDENPGHRSRTRANEVADITRGLKELSKELDIPIVCLSQLSRAVESRDNKRPVLSDLRESGDIEQDADIVAFVFREEYYERRNRPTRGKRESSEKYEQRLDAWTDHLADIHGKAELLIEKHRMGTTGKVHLYFDETTTTFSVKSHEEEPPDEQGEDFIP
jgi:replicative DNA helicase